MWDAAAQTDAGDLFGPDGFTLNTGGRAYRRQLIAAILSRSSGPTGNCIREADEIIEALTGSHPVAPQAEFTYPDALTEFMMDR